MTVARHEPDYGAIDKFRNALHHGLAVSEKQHAHVRAFLAALPHDAGVDITDLQERSGLDVFAFVEVINDLLSSGVIDLTPMPGDRLMVQRAELAADDAPERA